MNRRIAAVLGIGTLAWSLASQGVLAAAPAGAGASAASLGFVDAQKVFQSYKAAQEAQSRFRHEAQAYQDELADDQRKLEEARRANKSPEEISKMQKKFEEDLKPKKTRVEGLDRELSGKIKKQIEVVIAEVAKAKGVPTVVDKQVVLYGGIDLTDEVVRKLNR